jgi:2,4-didehydro-3-deoxy-L-rhamnonate hydrolase
MKICRFRFQGNTHCGFFDDQRVLPIRTMAERAGFSELVEILRVDQFDDLLPSDSPEWQRLVELHRFLEENPTLTSDLWTNRAEVQLLPPIARPNKLLLLAGNYAAHIHEQGGISAEREKTFPYVFLKPPTTTLVGDCADVTIPKISPDKIDHEVELAVVIGRQAKDVPHSQALDYVVGYTIVNDLSDRQFRPNPGRTERPRDKHFDWLHGKWHDGFCPCGPCLTTSDEIPDPQLLELRLWVDGELRQQGSTADQIFPVAAVIEFLSSWMTLEPGDIIATGTPSGVGNASGKYLQPGQTVVAEIPPIGHLTTQMVL